MTAPKPVAEPHWLVLERPEAIVLPTFAARTHTAEDSVRYPTRMIMLCASLAGAKLQAQFQMPLPHHLPESVVLHTKGMACKNLNLDSLGLEKPRPPKADVSTARGKADSTAARECKIIRHVIPSRLLARSDSAATNLFGGDALSALDQLGGGFSASQAYVYSNLIAGNAGDFRFNVSYLRAASRADSSDADTLGTLALRRSSDRLTQIVMNGGEATVRFLMPHLAVGGINWQSSWGSYLSAGLVGKIDEKAPVPVAFSFVSEFQTSLAIREPRTYKLLGEMYLAIRPGAAVVTGRDRVINDLPNRWLPFFQAAVGLRTSDGLRYGVAYTRVGSQFRTYLPTFQLIAQTTLPTVTLKK